VIGPAAVIRVRRSIAGLSDSALPGRWTGKTLSGELLRHRAITAANPPPVTSSEALRAMRRENDSRPLVDSRTK
jgi:hypothetical protein